MTKTPMTKSSDKKPSSDKQADKQAHKQAEPPQDKQTGAAGATDKEEAILRAEADGVPLADIWEGEGGLQFTEAADPGMQAELEKWQAQAGEWKDKALRAIAEEENTRARLERERGDMLKFAQAPLAKEILEVADVLARAIKSLQDTQEKTEELNGVLDGLQLTEQKMLEALQKNHIRKIGAVGDTFDAELHQAVSMVEDKTAAPNSIVEVLQAGYVLHDRVLRAAMVVVAKA